jgi:outer membrane lipoprotein SlyB
MNMSRKLVFLSTLSIAILLPACATAPSNNVYSRSEAGRAQSVQWGTVEAIRPVTIQNDSRGVGTATGATLGGIAGSTLGNGNRANSAGAVAGAVAGGAIGNAASAGTTAGVEITVRLETGQSIAVVQAGSPDEFRVGDRVRVTTGGGTSRVSR